VLEEWYDEEENYIGTKEEGIGVPHCKRLIDLPRHCCTTIAPLTTLSFPIIIIPLSHSPSLLLYCYSDRTQRLGRGL
jgi:hypothetical protein